MDTLMKAWFRAAAYSYSDAACDLLIIANCEKLDQPITQTLALHGAQSPKENSSQKSQTCLLFPTTQAMVSEV